MDLRQIIGIQIVFGQDVGGYHLAPNIHKCSEILRSYGFAGGPTDIYSTFLGGYIKQVEDLYVIFNIAISKLLHIYRIYHWDKNMHMK